MRSDPPSRVVLYALDDGTPRAVAEFRWSIGSGVSLDVLDPVHGAPAQRHFDEGVPFDAERRLVSSSEGEAFMRALVQPSRSTYTWYEEKTDS